MEAVEYLRMVLVVGSIGIVARRAGRLEGEEEGEEEGGEEGLVRGSRGEGKDAGVVAPAVARPRRSYLAWLSYYM